MRFNTFSILFLALFILGCERDDICADGTPTTPQLLIDFFDATDTETVKSVTRLSVYAEILVTDDTEVSFFKITFAALHSSRSMSIIC